MDIRHDTVLEPMMYLVLFVANKMHSEMLADNLKRNILKNNLFKYQLI